MPCVQVGKGGATSTFTGWFEKVKDILITVYIPYYHKDAKTSPTVCLKIIFHYQGLFSQSIRGAETGHFGPISENVDPF